MARLKKVVPAVKERAKRAKKVDGIVFQWEHLEVAPDQLMVHMTRRAKVLGGWLVQTFINKVNCAPVSTASFIADPKHKWVALQPELPPTPAAPAQPVPANPEQQAA